MKKIICFIFMFIVPLTASAELLKFVFEFAPHATAEKIRVLCRDQGGKYARVGTVPAKNLKVYFTREVLSGVTTECTSYAIRGAEKSGYGNVLRYKYVRPAPGKPVGTKLIKLGGG